MEVFYSSLPDTLREVMEENKRKTSTNKDDDVPAIESPPPLVESSDEEEKETAIAYIVEEVRVCVCGTQQYSLCSQVLCVTVSICT